MSAPQPPPMFTATFGPTGKGGWWFSVATLIGEQLQGYTEATDIADCLEQLAGVVIPLLPAEPTPAPESPTPSPKPTRRARPRRK